MYMTVKLMPIEVHTAPFLTECRPLLPLLVVVVAAVVAAVVEDEEVAEVELV